MPEEAKKCPCDPLMRAKDDIKKQLEKDHERDILFTEFKGDLKSVIALATETRGDVKTLMEKPAKKYEGLSDHLQKWAMIALVVIALAKAGIFV